MSQNIVVQIQNIGGNSRTLQVNAAAVIKAAPGTLFRVITQTVGTAGVLTINDTTTTGAAGAGNQVISLPFGNANIAAGGVLSVEFPCTSGIVISAVPTGWVGSVSWS